MFGPDVFGVFCAETDDFPLHRIRPAGFRGFFDEALSFQLFRPRTPRASTLLIEAAQAFERLS
jgi:hypothetical protein